MLALNHSEQVRPGKELERAHPVLVVDVQIPLRTASDAEHADEKRGDELSGRVALRPRRGTTT